MKKFLIATNIIVLAVAVFFCYKFFNIKDVMSGDKPILEGVQVSCPSKFCKDYSHYPWYGRITGFESRFLRDNYRNDLAKKYIWEGNARTGVEDARSAWFPLEVIKKYIWEIENRTCESECSDSLGIRIYYAKYPDSSSAMWSQLGVPLRYANHHTLFFLPTFWDARSGVHVDFDPWRGCRQPIDTSSVPSAESPALFLIGIGDEDAQNHGSLIPPDNPGGTGN